VGQPLSLSEAGSVAALQMSVSRQAAALTDARQQLTKLQLRVRLSSRDLKTSVRQVGAVNQELSEGTVDARLPPESNADGSFQWQGLHSFGE
jgi:hypothetical protein